MTVDAAPASAAHGLGRIAVALIRSYQTLTAGRTPHCRYLPTCSQYAVEAIETHGTLRGTWLAIRRIGRCHPWGGTGYDPVPTNVRSHHRCAVDDPARPASGARDLA